MLFLLHAMPVEGSLNIFLGSFVGQVTIERDLSYSQDREFRNLRKGSAVARVLAIDDDPDVLSAIRFAVESRGHVCLGASTAAAGLNHFRAAAPDVVFCDVHLNDLNGLDVLRQLHELDPALPIVMITGEQSSDLAISSNVHGAFDYYPKPLTASGLNEVVDRAIQSARAARQPAELALPIRRTGQTGLVGRCPAMLEVYRAIGRVAPQRLTVLVLGESGTGKELAARAIHQHSGRKGHPYVTVNCAAVPETLLESELFGHEKGSFTGADRRRTGRFEQANGGTLFLDEVGETTPGTQAKLLRVLQEQEFQRVGGDETLRTDTRIIAATNRNLLAMVAEGKFRADLYYRLSGYTIQLPPLRDRGDDLKLLVQHFLGILCDELRTAVTGLTAESVELLSRYGWPGNLRELQGVLRLAILRATGPVLTPDLFDLQPSGFLKPIAATKPEEAPEDFVAGRLAQGSKNLYAEWLARGEPELIRKVLAHFHGNITQAAEALGINRMTLRGRIRQYGLSSVE